MTSEDVRNDYVFRAMEAMGGVWSSGHTAYTIQKMADEILRLRAILAMLKKPDIDVLAAAMTAWSRTGDVPAMLHAALTTAEQEVGDG